MHDMINFHSRMFLFIASFSPMWLILIGSYLIYDFSPLSIIVSFSIILGIIASIVYSCNVFAEYRESINTEPVTLKYARNVTYKYTTHLIAYVFFVFIDITLPHNIFVIVALIFFVGIIFSRSNIVLTNPTLLAIGFRIYESEIDQPDREIILLSRYTVNKGDQIDVKEIAPGIFIDKLKY